MAAEDEIIKPDENRIDILRINVVHDPFKAVENCKDGNRREAKVVHETDKAVFFRDTYQKDLDYKKNRIEPKQIGSSRNGFMETGGKPNKK